MNRHRTSIVVDDATLPILEALLDEPSLSQRKLAERAGLSLTRTHFVLKRLVERGVLKVKTAAKSEHKLGYLYVLTPRGLDEKARLTYDFMQRTAQQYQMLTGRLRNVLDEAVGIANADGKSGPARVIVMGNGPVAEVLRDLIRLDARVDVSILAVASDVAIIVGQTVDSEKLNIPVIKIGGTHE